jgi:hypothetical protein
MSLRTITMVTITLVGGGLLHATGCAGSTVDPGDLSAPATGETSDSGENSPNVPSGVASDAAVSKGPDFGGGLDASTRPDAAQIRDATTDADARVSDGAVVPTDGSADAAPILPVTGSPCAPLGAIYNKKCGLCGIQEAACEADGKVGNYGLCVGEVAGGCVPGTSRMSACGVCGTLPEICQSTCKFVSGACTGEVVGGCLPGSVKTTTAGCTQVGEVRSQTCGATCSYGAPGACNLPSFPTLTISPALGATVSADFALSALTDQIPVIQNFDLCPEFLSSQKTSYSWVKLVNPNPTIATVSVWESRATGTLSDIDLVSAWYNTNTVPASTAERQACSVSSNDSCTDAPCVPGDYPGFINGGGADLRVVIPAGRSIFIYSAGYTSSTTGSYKLNARTDSL